MNPIGTVPVMLDGSFKILGATKVFLNYLANTYPKVSTRFPQENKDEFNQYMNWFAATLRPAVKSYVRMLVGPKAFGEPEHNPIEVEEARAFFSDVLKLTDGMLKGK